MWAHRRGASGGGVRARYWTLDAGSSSTGRSTTFPSDDTTVLDRSSNVEFHALDLEVTQDVKVRNWLLGFAGGLRYASSQINSFQSLEDSAIVADPQDEAIFHELDFEGVGPTFAIETRRARYNSNLALFANGRASLLFGQTRETLDIADNDPAFIPVRDPQFALDDRFNTVLPILETQIGIEYGRMTNYGRFFIRGAMEGQVWFSAGESPSKLMEFQENNLMDNRFLSPSDNIGLFGGTISLGLVR